jgi:hypothetical protein
VRGNNGREMWRQFGCTRFRVIVTDGVIFVEGVVSLLEISSLTFLDEMILDILDNVYFDYCGIRADDHMREVAGKEHPG